MASFTESIRLVFEASTGAASAAIAKLDTRLAKTGQTTEGLRGAANRAGLAIADMANPAVIGGALATAALGAARAFQQGALAAGDMAAATGLSVEQASRWAEVAGDVGVSTEAVSAALNKLNRTAATTDLSNLGITSTDANERLVQTLDYLNGITDSAQRAAEGTRLLGKGWQTLAPLITDAATARKALADVSDAQVFDDREVARARQMRDNLARLADVGEQVKLTWGGDLAAGLNGIVVIVDKIGGAFDRLPDAPPWLSTIAKWTPPFWARDAAEWIMDIGDNAAEADEKAAKMTGSLRAAGVETEQAMRDAAEATTDLADAAAKAVDSFDALASGMLDSRAAARQFRQAQTDARDALVDLGKKGARPAVADLDAFDGALDDLVQSALRTPGGMQQALGAIRDLQTSAGRGSPAWFALEALRLQLEALSTDVVINVNVNTSAALAKLDEVERRIAAARGGFFGPSSAPWSPSQTTAAVRQATARSGNPAPASRIVAGRLR
jgi:hypothetical protein